MLRNARIDGGAIRADLHYLRGNPLAESVADDAARNLGCFGLSHNASAGRESIRDGKYVVESISQVRSVDLVTRPATNKNLFESQGNPMTITLKTILESRMAKLSRAKRAWAKNLLEDGDMPGMDAPMDAPMGSDMDAPSGGDPDELLKQGFRAAINAVLDDDGMDAASKLKKIKELLMTHEKLTDSKEPDMPSESEPMDDEKDTPESIRTELKQLRAEKTVNDLCESMQFVPTKPQKKALVALADDAARKDLIEDLKKVQTHGKTPRSRSLVESTNHDAKQSKNADEWMPSGRI